MKRFVKSLGLLLTAAVLIVTVVVPVFALETNAPVVEPAKAEEQVSRTIVTTQQNQSPAVRTAEPPKVQEEKPAAAPVVVMASPAAVPAVAAETIPEETIPEETVEVREPTLSEQLTGVPLYLQNDYAHVLYGTGTIASDGCGITSLAMVATHLTGHTYTPEDLANWFSRYEGKNNMDRLQYVSDQLQLPWKKSENWHQTLKALDEGCIAIALMNARSSFTFTQHFIVLTGLTEDGRVLINDPDGENYEFWELKPYFEDGFPDWFIPTGYDGAWIYDPSEMPEEPFIYEPEETEYVEPRYPDITLTPSEVRLLARMVWVESRGEPFEGQQAVAEVVLNRLSSEDFGNTLHGVIYAENQFRSTEYLEDAEPTHTQFEAIRCALNGPYVLPKEVVHFATYAVNDNIWGQIGGHVFCYQWDDVLTEE